MRRCTTAFICSSDSSISPKKIWYPLISTVVEVNAIIGATLSHVSTDSVISNIDILNVPPREPELIVNSCGLYPSFHITNDTSVFGETVTIFSVMSASYAIVAPFIANALHPLVILQRTPTESLTTRVVVPLHVYVSLVMSVPVPERVELFTIL